MPENNGRKPRATPFKQGVNSKFVQGLLGHGDVSLTLNIYSRMLPDMGGQAAMLWRLPNNICFKLL